MKKLAIVTGILAVVFVSCTKKEANGPSAPVVSTQRAIQVEYRITDVSGNVSITYIAPQSGSNTLTTQTAVISKTYSVISFSSKSNNFFSISARNVNVSTQDVTVDIYVDGVLFKSGSLDHATMTASASGKVE
jgi:hypothetical protein